MNTVANESSFFSKVYIDLCKGMCCDPWWGIISYTIVKEGVISNPDNFKKEIEDGLHDRVKRITEAYVTNEDLRDVFLISLSDILCMSAT